MNGALRTDRNSTKFIRFKATRNRTRIALQIVESRRVGGRVRQTVLEYLGTVDASDEEAIERMKAEGRRRIEFRNRGNLHPHRTAIPLAAVHDPRSQADLRSLQRQVAQIQA